MSSYQSITRHPQTGLYEVAGWLDDYYGQHLYGVKFESDGKTYPPELVNKKVIQTFWVEDVLAALKTHLINGGIKQDNYKKLNLETAKFLNLIQKEYKARWKRDPMDGEGALKWLQNLKADKS